jgi:hypothetical protein
MAFDYEPALGLYISVDPGYSNPFACLWIMPVEKGERLLVLDEYYQRFRTTPENAKAIAKQHQEMGHPPLRMGYGDPANPERLVLLSEVLGIEVKGPRLPVRVGQEMVRQWIERRYDGQPCLIIHHRCKNLIRELKNYREHEPGKGNHHALDALRYFFCGWLGA